MSDQKTDVSRRSVLKGIAVVPFAVAMGYAGAARADMLDPADPTAQALGYVETSATDGQHCANCNLYQGGAAAQGACPIFSGKEVKATGWCKSWVAKA